MPIDLSRVKTIVMVMMKNRSFDHLLGYLSLAPYNWTSINGLNTSPAGWIKSLAFTTDQNIVRLC